MKQIVLIAALAFSASVFGQSEMKEDVDLIQAAWGKTKRELVAAYMNVEEAKATAFWKVYDKYEAERKALGRKRIQLINDYAINYDTLTNAKADQLVRAMHQNNIAYENLHLKYYGQVKTILGAVNAAKFIQLESALQTFIKGEIQEAIPFIGEIEREKKN
ncbi:MAG TPA: hypothetical protein VIZ28_11675 [Chitinophagaceae bacterium]